MVYNYHNRLKKIWIKLNKQSIIITVKDWLKLNIWEYSSVGRAIDC